MRPVMQTSLYTRCITAWQPYLAQSIVKQISCTALVQRRPVIDGHRGNRGCPFGGGGVYDHGLLRETLGRASTLEWRRRVGPGGARCCVQRILRYAMVHGWPLEMAPVSC